MDLDLMRSVALLFRLNRLDVEAIIERSYAIMRQWSKLATLLDLSAREQEIMSPAFRLAEMS